MPIRRGATGQKGRRGERGIPGPPGAPGTAGVEGSQGREGPRGETGSQGPEGAAGPAGKVPDVVKVAEQLEYIDRSVENIYREMGNHITRMTQLQRELDALRDHVRRKMPASLLINSLKLRMPQQAMTLRKSALRFSLGRLIHLHSCSGRERPSPRKLPLSWHLRESS